MTVPAVRAIKAGRPDARITILTKAKLADFWRLIPEVDGVIGVPDGESDFQNRVAAAHTEHFDVAILLPNSPRSGLEAWLAGIPRRVGYPGHRRRFLLNQVIETKKKRRSRIRRNPSSRASATAPGAPLSRSREANRRRCHAGGFSAAACATR